MQMSPSLMINDLELAPKLPDDNTTYRHCCVLWTTLGLHFLTPPHLRTLGMRLSHSLSLRKHLSSSRSLVVERKQFDPFVRVNSACACCDCPTLPSWPGCANQSVYKEKNWPGHSARWVTLLVEPTFCFSCKRFVTFYKEMYEKLADPG